MQFRKEVEAQQKDILVLVPFRTKPTAHLPKLHLNTAPLDHRDKNPSSW